MGFSERRDSIKIKLKPRPSSRQDNTANGCDSVHAGYNRPDPYSLPSTSERVTICRLRLAQPQLSEQSLCTSDRNWLIRTLLLSERQSDDRTCRRQAHCTTASAVAAGDSGGEETVWQFGRPALYGSLDDLQCTAVWMTCSVRQFG